MTFSKTSLGVLAAVALLQCPGTPAIAQQGHGPSALSSAIDGDIGTVLQDLGIVGMTVAVTRDGRLIYSKGFGLARRAEDGAGGDVLMQPTHRTRIGSVSKAIISGPATYQALSERGFDPKSKKIYGNNSILGETYSSYQRMAIERFQPIVAMAISPRDHVYAFYDNGMRSVGTSTNLTARKPAETFKVAPGKKIADLHAVAISKAGRVHAWYKDGTMSMGSSRNLASLRSTEVGNDEPKVNFPVGPDGDRKSMHDVVGIAFAKSDNDVYIWYDDGTVSSGTPMDFTANFVNRPYSAPVLNGQPGRYQIRGMGISRNDHVYAWASGKKAFSGNSRYLTAYHQPYDYSHAFDRPYRNRFRDITVQHVFDHKAGFTRSGDVAATARTFTQQVPEGTEPSYDLIHKHFVMTRPLMSDPGTTYSYSNHGMGMTTLLIAGLTGESYLEYTVNGYLKPMGLKRKIRPQKVNVDAADSSAYELRNSGPDPLPFKNSTVGLAAGGWTAPAQGILALTAELADRHTPEEIDGFGWHKSATGRLSHSGSTGGGYAYASLFPGNYVHPDGHDVAGIHVAIASNTRDSRKSSGDRFGSELRKLTNRIAIVAANSPEIPADLDYWPVAWD